MAAAYFGAQWIFAPLIGYEVWRAPLALLIGFLVIFEVLALLVPMWSFHEILLAFQQQELARADRIGTQIDGLQQQICDHPGPETAKSLREQITELTAQYAAIEALPKWPIPARVRRRFAIRNLVLLLPVFAEILGASKSWHDLLDQLGRIVSGGP